MRSNIARTWPSSRTPGVPAAISALLAEGAEEVHEHAELLGREVREGRHRRRRVDERPRDRLARQPARDVLQRRPGAVVAALAELVAGQAARLGGDLLARVVVGHLLPAGLRDVLRDG